mmetsp:Transcript_6167/g.8991  ORF Transcript_6167/g.8991 Transcript_6167/m.8991 type:complete len:86 (+) Transcript_6167:280-537(+)
MEPPNRSRTSKDAAMLLKPFARVATASSLMPFLQRQSFRNEQPDSSRVPSAEWKLRSKLQSEYVSSTATDEFMTKRVGVLYKGGD